MSAIVVENLSKCFRIAQRKSGTWGAISGLFRRQYRSVQALDGVSFSIEPGELVGYIGPNGAGKSTTVKILSGILVPDGGRVSVLGQSPWKHRRKVVGRIGAVFGQRTQLWWDLPVVESFELLRDIYRIAPADYRRSLDEMVALLELQNLLDVPVRQLSLGQRMRCDLAAALLHSPEILYLDEPTIGLDAISKLAVRDFVRGLAAHRQVSVILTTHDMDDIEALCQRVIVIHQGRILSDGTLGQLRQKVSPERRLIIDLAEDDGQIADPAATVISRQGRRVTLGFDPEQVSPAELIARVTAAHRVADLFVENPPIEEIIARIYRGAGTSAGQGIQA